MTPGNKMRIISESSTSASGPWWVLNPDGGVFPEEMVSSPMRVLALCSIDGAGVREKTTVPARPFTGTMAPPADPSGVWRCTRSLACTLDGFPLKGIQPMILFDGSSQARGRHSHASSMDHLSVVPSWPSTTRFGLLRSRYAGGGQPACRRFFLDIYEKIQASDVSRVKTIEAASRVENIQLKAKKLALEESVKINAGIIEKLQEALAYKTAPAERIQLDTYDQLAVTAISSAQPIVRQVQMAEGRYEDKVVGTSGEQHTLETNLFAGALPRPGLRICPAVSEWIATELRGESAILKERRKAREERTLAETKS